MLTDEQLIEKIRSELRAELADLNPPSNFLDRLHRPAARQRGRSRLPPARLPAAGSQWRIPSAGSAIAIFAVVVSITVAVFAIAVLGHGRGAGTDASNSRGPTTAPGAPVDQVLKLLNGIPQAGTQLGDPTAPVTMVVFADLECPLCRVFTLQGGFPTLVQTDVRQGKVKVDYRSLCTSTCNGPGPGVFDTQQVAAYAAGKQRLFWDYAELFYHEQGAEDTRYATASYLTGLAKQVPNLNLNMWQTDRHNPDLLSQVRADEIAAISQRLTGTPTLIIEGPKGTKRLPGAVPRYSELQRAIKQVQ